MNGMVSFTSVVLSQHNEVTSQEQNMGKGLVKGRDREVPSLPHTPGKKRLGSALKEERGKKRIQQDLIMRSSSVPCLKKLGNSGQHIKIMAASYISLPMGVFLILNRHE